MMTHFENSSNMTSYDVMLRNVTSQESNVTSQEMGVSWQELMANRVGLACGILTVLFNSLVLCIALRHIDFNSKLNQVFVVSMTTADLLFGISYMITRPILKYIPLVLCGPYYIANWSCQIGSVLFLLFLNVDKFISLYYPLHYPALITSRKVWTQTLLSWLLVFSVATFSYLGPFSSFETSRENKTLSCDLYVRIHALYYAIYTLSFYILPVLISIGISVYIFYIAQTAGRSEASQYRRQKRRKQFLTRILFVFSSTVWTSFTLLPFRIAYTGYKFCLWTFETDTISTNSSSTNQTNVVIPKYGVEADACSQGAIRDMINILMYYILPLGAVGNPLITILTQNIYRIPVMQMLVKFLGWIKLPQTLVPRMPSDRQATDDDESKLHDQKRPIDSMVASREKSCGANFFDVV